MSQTAAAQSQVATVAPLTLNQTNMPSTSAAPPPAQATYRKIAQPSVEQVKPPKLVPPASYKRDPEKTSKRTKVAHADSCDARTDPITDASSFDSFARGVSRTGDYYSAASGMTTRRSDYHTAYSSAVAGPQMQTLRDLVPRPVATSTQQKTTAKRNLEPDHGEIEEMLEVNNETPDIEDQTATSTSRSNIDGHVEGLRTATSSQGVQE